MFEDTIKKLLNLPDWKYLGLMCFTEIENRAVFVDLTNGDDDKIMLFKKTRNQRSSNRGKSSPCR